MSWARWCWPRRPWPRRRRRRPGSACPVGEPLASKPAASKPAASRPAASKPAASRSGASASAGARSAADLLRAGSPSRWTTLRPPARASASASAGCRPPPGRGHGAGGRGRPWLRDDRHRGRSTWPDVGPLRRTRNLLLVNLRGTGTSTPVNCPGLEHAGSRQSGATSTRWSLPAARQLNHTWRYRGGGWVHASDHFNTAYSARDVARVAARAADRPGRPLRRLLRQLVLPGLRVPLPGHAALGHAGLDLPGARTSTRGTRPRSSPPGAPSPQACRESVACASAAARARLGADRRPGRAARPRPGQRGDHDRRRHPGPA